MVVSSNTAALQLTRKQLQDYFGNKPDLIRAMELVFGTTAQIITVTGGRIGGTGGTGGGSGGGSSGAGNSLIDGAGIDSDPAHNREALELLHLTRALIDSVLLQPRSEVITPDIDTPPPTDFVRWGDLLNIFQTLYQSPLALSTMAEQSKTNVQIQGGAIDGTAIGGVTPAAGSFTTLSASGLISPTSSVGVKGTTINDNAQAGSIGEYITAGPNASAALTAGAALSVANISLTAGDWDVSGVTGFYPAAGASLTTIQNNVTINNNTIDGTTGTRQLLQLAFGANSQVVTSPIRRFSFSATTTVYIVSYANFTGTCASDGFIRARRVR